MQSLAQAVDVGGLAFVAPQAAGHTWYPHSFLAPLSQNEPWLESALNVVFYLMKEARNPASLPLSRLVVMGFSQGACLASESVAREANRYGGLVALSGGLIGTGDIGGKAAPRDKEFSYEGTLDGTPVFLGCSDVDAHIPVERVEDTARVLAELGGNVDKRIYEGMGHTIIQDEIDAVREMLEQVARSPSD